MTFEEKIFAAVLAAVEAVGLDAIRKGPFFGIGESRGERKRP